MMKAPARWLDARGGPQPPMLDEKRVAVRGGHRKSVRRGCERGVETAMPVVLISNPTLI